MGGWLPWPTPLSPPLLSSLSCFLQRQPPPTMESTRRRMTDMSIRTHASRPFSASDVNNIHNGHGTASALNTFPFGP
ncbi:hypothetical protein LZ31DRAFT_548688 [Colletotrichum somersetense]|nr:hypothetical protein LZ31DRAFT_548688 [Colletotrichum somersetense]